MDITHHPPPDLVVSTMVDTCSSVYAVTLSEEKASHAIIVLESVMLVMGVPWAIKTDNDPDYGSQQLNKFL